MMVSYQTHFTEIKHTTVRQEFDFTRAKISKSERAKNKYLSKSGIQGGMH